MCYITKVKRQGKGNKRDHRDQKTTLINLHHPQRGSKERGVKELLDTVRLG